METLLTASKYIARLEQNIEKQQIIVALLDEGVISVDACSGRAYSSRNPRGISVPLGVENTDGYIVCTLHYQGSRRQYRIHQIIWISQNGMIPKGLVVDHINGDRKDNRITNLRLLSLVENWLHRRSYVGAGNPAAKITLEGATKIRESRDCGYSYREIAKIHNVSKSLVAQIVRGELWNN